ncbi:serine/threonine-protein kinase [Streptomyces uncialis]|uniref:serine/threonine-protein kinase n=1 Tax=Streptomyces uncialis TaxID=1048205 RepID=UPI0037A6E974
MLCHGADEDPPWLATEFVPGPSLGEAIRTYGPLDVRRLGVFLAAALRQIHLAGLVHRDLKPSNVMLSDGGPVIIDFGIARAYEDTRLTGSGPVGTSGYIAPEYLGHGRFDARSDVFALGAVLAFAASGRSPYGTGHPAAVDVRVLSEEPDLTGIDAPVAHLLRACLARDPAERPTSARLGTELSGLSGGAPPWPPPVLAAEIARRTREAAEQVGYVPTVGDSPDDPLRGTRTRTAARPVPPPHPQRPTHPHPESLPQRSSRPDPPLSQGSSRPAGAGRRRLPRRKMLLGLAALSTAGAGAYRVADLFQDEPPDPRQNWHFAPVREMGEAVMAGGTLYLGSHENSNLYAVDASTGRQRWVYEAESRMAHKPAVLGTTVFAASWENKLHAVDITTGRRRWSVPLAGPEGGAVAAGDKLVYARAPDGYLYGLDPATGRRRWRFRTGEGMPTGRTPVAAGTVFVMTNDGLLHAVDGSTGRSRWKFSATGDTTSGSPAVHGGTLCLGTEERWVHALDTASGEQRWKRRLGGAIGDVHVQGDAVYVHCQDQFLYALDARAGTQRWRCQIGPGTEGVAVDGDTVYAGRSHPTKLLALDSRTGKPRWEVRLRNPSALPWGEDHARISSEIHVSGRDVYFTALGLYSFRIGP